MFLFRLFSLGSRAQALEGEKLFTKKPLLCYENIASSDIILFLTTTSLLGICSELWMPDVGFYSTRMLDVAANAGEVKGKLVYVYSVYCHLQLCAVYSTVVRNF